MIGQRYPWQSLFFCTALVAAGVTNLTQNSTKAQDLFERLGDLPGASGLAMFALGLVSIRRRFREVPILESDASKQNFTS